jgi:hypothetical protein
VSSEHSKLLLNRADEDEKLHHTATTSARSILALQSRTLLDNFILKKNANPAPLNGRGRPKTGGKRFKAIQEMKQEDAAEKKQRWGGEQEQEQVNIAAPIAATSGSTGPLSLMCDVVGVINGMT